MDYLWTPWRYSYVTHAGELGDCIFCAAPKMADAESLIVYRGQYCYVILNRFPYTSGHVMVTPYAHTGTLEAMPNETLAEMIFLARACESKLRSLYRPDGLNLGINLGKSAGAGVADHLHMHVLPRWTGDTSFMTVAAETRVLPESLEITWQRLQQAFAAPPPQPAP